jgi:hypothetical protein
MASRTPLTTKSSVKVRTTKPRQSKSAHRTKAVVSAAVTGAALSIAGGSAMAETSVTIYSSAARYLRLIFVIASMLLFLATRW